MFSKNEYLIDFNNLDQTIDNYEAVTEDLHEDKLYSITMTTSHSVKNHDSLMQNLLVINGSMQGLRRLDGFYSSILALLNSKNKNYRLISYDHGGAGDSDFSLLTENNCNMKQYSKFVKRVLDFYKIKEINILGISFGGMVALNFACDSEINKGIKINKLIISCASYRLNSYSKSVYTIAKTSSTYEFIKSWTLMMDSRCSQGYNLIYRIVPYLAGLAFTLIPILRHSNSKVRDEYWNRLRLLQLKARDTHDVTLEYKNITANETLLVSGGYDLTVSSSDLVEMSKTIKNCSSYIFETENHLFFNKLAAKEMMTGFL